MGKPITLGWQDEIQRDRETRFGIYVEELPKEAITVGAYSGELKISYSQALKTLNDKVKTGRATLKLYKVRGIRQTVNGYVLK